MAQEQRALDGASARWPFSECVSPAAACFNWRAIVSCSFSGRPARLPWLQPFVSWQRFTTRHNLRSANAPTALWRRGRLHFALHLSSAFGAEACVFCIACIYRPAIYWGVFYTNPLQPKTQPPFGLGCHVSHAPCSASIPALDCGIADGLARPLHTLAAFRPAAHGRFVSRWVPKRHCAEGIFKLALPRHRARIGFGPRPFPLSGYLLCGRHASVWPQRAARGPPSCDVQAGRCGATTQTPRSATVALAAMRRCDLFSHTFCGLMEAAGTVGTVCTSLFRSSRKVIPWNFSSRRA